MNAAFELKVQDSPASEKWSVVVLYEDKVARDRAMEICDGLMRRFWSEVELTFHWWRTDFLQDAGMAQTAATNACDADLIIFSSRPEADLPLVLTEWFASWVGQRRGYEGAFVDLTPRLEPAPPHAERKQNTLREFAGRTGLDYLTRIPASLNGPPDSKEARAAQVTAVLDDMWHYAPPPHYGINE